MLGEVFERFVEKSPVSVMVRGLLERVLNPEKLDALFYRTALKQYTRDLLFSTVFELLCQVVCGLRSSVHAAYQRSDPAIGVSITSVYNKLNGIEPSMNVALVQYSANELRPLIEQMAGGPPPLLAGYRSKILDGHCLDATQHRIDELRPLQAGALPGKALVVFDPALRLAIDVLPCADGHAQERSLLDEVLETVEPGDLWIADRNFCTLKLLFGITRGKASFLIREHALLPWEAVTSLRKVGRIDTGRVYEQTIRLVDDQGHELRLRRVRLQLDQPTRDGNEEIIMLTDVPPQAADARTLAPLYGQRWTIEGAFQEMAQQLNAEINTLGYPQAALFGFCIGLVAYNVLSVVKAALRSVHGAEKIEPEVSGYYVANELRETYQGMMIAVPQEHWLIFRLLTLPQMAEVLVQLAHKVRLSTFRKHPRGPKKPPPKRVYNKKQPHVSTAKLLAGRKE